MSTRSAPVRGRRARLAAALLWSPNQGTCRRS